uniref:Uncharacterized protein n=1 Tax=Marmota marmota marmota TaxID=9994 RepID=A0A8C5Z187_MARMA
MAQEKMEIDLELPPNFTTTTGNALRRANSVPLVNGFGLLFLEFMEVLKVSPLSLVSGDPTFSLCLTTDLHPQNFGFVGRLHEKKQVANYNEGYMLEGTRTSSVLY